MRLPRRRSRPSLAAVAAFLALPAFAAAQSAIDALQGLTFPGHFGASVAGLGDVDGDGFDDFVIGAPNAYAYFNGSAVVYSGRDRTKLYTFNGADRDKLGASVAGPGDLDGDGVPDIAVGAIQYYNDTMKGSGYVRSYSGATGHVLWTCNGLGIKEYLGTSLAVIGDVDADGVADLVAGSQGHFVQVISGRTGDKLAGITYSGIPSFGWRVGAAGDIDLDGTPDFLVGAPTGIGIVRLYSGSDFGLIREWYGNPFDELLGSAIAGGVDFDQDGVADIVLGAPGADGTATNAGEVRIRSGATDEVLRTIAGPSAGANFGGALAILEDIDADEVPDLAISAPAELDAAGLGAVHVVSGATGLEVCSVRGDPGVPAGSFGSAVAEAGDLDGDGHSDLVIGSPNDTGYGMAYLVGTLPLGTDPYGTGTPGCDGAHALLANSVPRAGNADFQLNADEAAPLASGWLLIGLQQDLAGTVGKSVVFHVSFGGPMLVLPVTANALGVVGVPLPIPSTPMLVGVDVFAQVVWSWAGDPCQPTPSDLSTTPGLAITIQP